MGKEITILDRPPVTTPRRGIRNATIEVVASAGGFRIRATNDVRPGLLFEAIKAVSECQ